MFLKTFDLRFNQKNRNYQQENNNIKMKIEINTNCTRCSKCVRVCPGKVLQQELPKAEVRVAMPEMCIVCGHCVAVCAENAIEHTEFPKEKVHKIDYSLYPTPEQLMLLIKARRSNRAFSKKEIPQEFLQQIIVAAYRAPTASNLQQVDITIITNFNTLHQISNFTINVFNGIVKLVDNIVGRLIFRTFLPDTYKFLPVFKKMKSEFDAGDDFILRNATAVLLIHSPKSSRFGCEDSNLAYQNASLMAESLGVAHFYTGFVCSATKQKTGKLEKMLGIDGKIHAGMALAMPLFKFENYVDRTRNQ